MHARFYAPDLEVGDASVTLPIDEARHALRVLRLRLGDVVQVFNGRGLQRFAHVAAIERDLVTLAVEGDAPAAAESAIAITLAQAVLKADGMDGVVRDAVMLGVRRIVPLLTLRVEGDRRSHAAGLRVERWRRIAVASAKQCGRAVVPDIAAPMSLAACLSSEPAAARLAFVEPGTSLPAAGLGAASGVPAPASALLLVGPEGGWADEELRLLAGYDAQAVTLGRRTLRAESAAIVALSALHTAWGEF